LLYKLRDLIVLIINFFHKPFARFIPAQTFRYLACGGGNTLLGIILFYLIYKYQFHESDNVLIGSINAPSRALTSVMVNFVNFPIGFLLSSYVVFPESQLRGRVQLFRYLITTITFLLLGSVMNAAMGIALPMIPAWISNIFVIIVIVILSYISQRMYTFKVPLQVDEPDPVEETEM